MKKNRKVVFNELFEALIEKIELTVIFFSERKPCVVAYLSDVLTEVPKTLREIRNSKISAGRHE